MVKMHVIETGNFKLDGGAMFGVVPKKLWEKLNPPDVNNMCTWSMRCLLVEDGDRKILIDTGLGNKQDDKFRSHFEPHGDDSLEASLKHAGFSKSDITDVLLTHLHFDHVGGAVEKTSNGELLPTFPNAKYWTNEKHYNWAFDPNPREAASFLKENFVPLKDHGVLQMIDVQEDITFSDHINLKFVYGHTESMMIPHIQMNDGTTLIYAADLMPSHGHVRMPYVMGYDIRPLETLKERKALYEYATDDNHYLFFEHDKDYACGKVSRNERGRVVFSGPVNFNELPC